MKPEQHRDLQKDEQEEQFHFLLTHLHDRRQQQHALSHVSSQVGTHDEL